MEIQWYPGHMAKTRRQLKEDLRLIDAVIEIADARAPAASRNPDFDDLFQGKARIVLLNKADLADPKVSADWIRCYHAQGILSDAVVANAGGAKKAAVTLIERATCERVAAMKEKGVSKVVRCMVTGIPNTGKSTLINRICGSARAETGDRPGVTKSRQWVRISPYLELMDTPGLLWPKLDNQQYALHLAFIGSVKDDIMDTERLAEKLLLALRTLCPEALGARYAAIRPEVPQDALLDAVAQSRGFIRKGGIPDTDRAARIVLDEFRAGKIGRVSLERPEEEHAKDA